MRALVHAVLMVLGVCAAFVLVSTLLGLGVARQGPPLLVALTATIFALVPPLGLAGLIGKRSGAMGASLVLWSVAAFVALPLYFPGERHDAMATGFAMAGHLFGFAPDEALVARLDAVAPAPESRPVPPKAIEPVVPELPPSQATLPDQVALPYEGRRNTLLLPISIEGKRRDHELWMLFDTGATLTTLTTDDLADIGVRVTADAPTVTMHTAAGDRTARLVLLDQMWIGGYGVDGVTVSVCDPCADDKASGLLGLNVSGQFLVTLDTVRHELVLQPRTGRPDRTLDVQPWVDISGNAMQWPDGRSEVEVSVVNNADRTIEELIVHVACDRTFETRLVNVPPKGEASTLVSLPRDASCERYTLSLEYASW